VQAPELPALSEFIPGFDFTPMVGIFARAGTSGSILQRIATDAMALTHDAEVITKLAAIGVETAGAGPGEFELAIESERNRAASAIKAAGLIPR
jgi:tripartite-type tricarboxylate transporter receptor subunit TctC